MSTLLSALSSSLSPSSFYIFDRKNTEKRARELMLILGLNKTTAQLAIVNSICCMDTC